MNKEVVRAHPISTQQSRGSGNDEKRYVLKRNQVNFCLGVKINIMMKTWRASQPKVMMLVNVWHVCTRVTVITVCVSVTALALTYACDKYSSQV